MQQRRKNMWVDQYADIADESAQPSAQQLRQDEPSAQQPDVSVRWRDQMTGAEYDIKSKAVTGPQGDYRVSDTEADHRYRVMMGESADTAQPHTEAERGRALTAAERDDLRAAEPKDDPEPRVSMEDIERRYRDRIMEMERIEQMLKPTTERPEWAEETVPDKPWNRVGYNEDVRDYGPGDTKMVGLRPMKPITGRDVIQPAAPSADPVTFKLKSSDATVMLLNNALSGLFGESAANHVVSRVEQMDQAKTILRPGFERPLIAHVLMDHGLIKPWAPPDNLKEVSAQKPDTVAYTVGLRALETVIRQNTLPEFMEASRSDRDAVAVAVGRAVLNMTGRQADGSKPAVGSAAHQPLLPVGERPELTADVKQFLARSLQPSILAHALPPELRAAQRKIETVASVPAALPVDQRLAVQPQPPRRIESTTEARLRQLQAFDIERPERPDMSVASENENRRRAIVTAVPRAVDRVLNVGNTREALEAQLQSQQESRGVTQCGFGGVQAPAAFMFAPRARPAAAAAKARSLWNNAEDEPIEQPTRTERFAYARGVN